MTGYTEQHFLSRVEPPTFYRAPSNIDATCKFCGHPLRPGEIIGDWEEDYFHEDCVTSRLEDELEEYQ